MVGVVGRWQLSSLIEQVKLECLLDENGCWLWDYREWQTTPHVSRYPKICVTGEQRTVACWMLSLSSGHDGEVARHRCDVASCVNPDHLEWGSQLDNIHDTVARGRTAKGARNGVNTHPESRTYGKVHDSHQRGDDHWSRRIPQTHMSRQVRKCECGMTTNPGAMMGHLRKTGHALKLL